MDLIANLSTGFAVALTPANLGFCFLGALIGTLATTLWMFLSFNSVASSKPAAQVD